jgi:acyl carrier protein
MSTLERQIIEAIARESRTNPEEIRLDSELYGLGIDSLSALELLAELEKRYDIRIPESGLKSIHTVREIIDLIRETKSAAGDER